MAMTITGLATLSGNLVLISSNPSNKTISRPWARQQPSEQLMMSVFYFNLCQFMDMIKGKVF